MRTRIELLNLVLENKDLFEFGYCGWVRELWLADIITYEEYLELNNILEEYKPKNTLTLNGSWCYWEKKIISYRINWINRTIKKIKKLEASLNNDLVTL